MRRTILLATVLPFISAFLGGALALSLGATPEATAQSSELQEVRASAFTLVGPDGTVLARLQRADFDGTGVLQMYDAAGTRRLSVVGAGTVAAWGQDGTTQVFRAGRTFWPGPTGNPPINGVELGPDGSISMIPPSP